MQRNVIKKKAFYIWYRPHTKYSKATKRLLLIKKFQLKFNLYIFYFIKSYVNFIVIYF